MILNLVKWVMYTNIILNLQEFQKMYVFIKQKQLLLIQLRSMEGGTLKNFIITFDFQMRWLFVNHRTSVKLFFINYSVNPKGRKSSFMKKKSGRQHLHIKVTKHQKWTELPSDVIHWGCYTFKYTLFLPKIH